MSNNKKLLTIGTGALFLSIIAAFGLVKEPNLQAQELEDNTTIEEITEEESNLIGQEVTVRGEVEEVEPGVSFILEQEEGFLGIGEDDVLVINISEKVVPITATDDLGLQVTGEVGNLVLADIEQQYGLTLDPNLYVDYENRPVIFADYIVLSPELEDVSENPDIYYLQEIAVEGEVDQIVNDSAFTLKEEQLVGGEDLLIINVAAVQMPAQDETVVVTGIVRPYVQAEFERDYDLDWDLDVQQQIEAEYTEKPVLVLDAIYPSAEDESILE